MINAVTVAITFHFNIFIAWNSYSHFYDWETISIRQNVIHKTHPDPNRWRYYYYISSIPLKLITVLMIRLIFMQLLCMVSCNCSQSISYFNSFLFIGLVELIMAQRLSYSYIIALFTFLLWSGDIWNENYGSNIQNSNIIKIIITINFN